MSNGRELRDLLHEYAEERGLEHHSYSEYHNRVFYHGIEVPVLILDVWAHDRTWDPHYKYWVKESNYMHGIVERGGETGYLPRNKRALYKALDELFFAVEIKEAKEYGTQ